VGVTETVATIAKDVPASVPLSRFQQPEFWIKEADSLRRLLLKKEATNPKFKSLPVPAPDKLKYMFETWSAQRPDLQFKSPASSGFFDETFGFSVPTLNRDSGFFDEEYKEGKRVQPDPARPLAQSAFFDDAYNEREPNDKELSPRSLMNLHIQLQQHPPYR
jgi:hypothetical protein